MIYSRVGGELLSKTKKTFLTVTAVLFLLAVLFVTLTVITNNPVCYSLAITFSTAFYHFGMRLLVGTAVKKQFNYKNSWFSEKRFEKKLYKMLKVKKWKGRMPSYNPSSEMTKHTDLTETVNTMCRNEVIHESIALLSLVPILFSLRFGEWAVFITTSLIACFADLIFVVMQRYNRPRILRIMERKSRYIKTEI